MNHITYSTNWTGPINTEWCATNGYDWSGGRIDVQGIEDDIFGTEISIPIMKSTDWDGFSDYLLTKRTDTVWSLDDLVADYERESNTKITWFKPRDKDNT